MLKIKIYHLENMYEKINKINSIKKQKNNHKNILSKL